MKSVQIPLGPLIGIGSSAGGLEAMALLTSRLRANGRARYVIAQHMAKSGHSELVVRILARKSNLPIIEATDGELVLPDRLYLIPSNHNGLVRNGRIELRPPVSGQPSVPSVDVLLKSIAEDARSNALALILSGAGSDGALGARAIRSNGGRVIAQSPESALIAGMIDAARRAGAVDEFLDPEKIADRLNELFPVPWAPPESVAADPETQSNALRELIGEVARNSRVDFTTYKEDTLLRRIRGRMKILSIATLDDYASFAKKDSRELEILARLFVVSLSWFFRDRAAFAKLEEILEAYLSQKPDNEPMRVWVPGCATGEECYSLAILLTEIGLRIGRSRPIEIVGSDLNPDALDIARRRNYGRASFKEISSSDLAPGSVISTGDEASISPAIASLCRFQNEDVVAGSSPGNLDLISCRNLLIYMKTELQEHMVRKFWDAIRPNGLLFLGLSENIGRRGIMNFAVLDASHRIFGRKAGNWSA